ncbi:chloramphenicol acetyltransferase [Meridianimarinicoccus aquatilis]|uniref:Chloramphenicol acetyltransferase n=1 Tax=Meridianimarinicoccus aquatilis TaxID=2552766 RepID=A0A4V3BB01_9RHOB|nr:chloramphenicol acetyltransferase [Fluviibacterium aquatile]TDL85149.1 chloramphenicol acetyltransferase [Fluviibacterium aquatile]
MARLTEGAPYVHPDCEITDTEFGRFVEIGRGSRVAHSTIGDYSYCDRYSDIANAEILKFSNIASFTRIGATDHPMDKASLHHFHYRSNDYWDDAAPDEAWLAHRRTRRAVIGHDTWIGHGAMIKPEVTLGHGSVVASGAIVTRDVDPYTVVAGLPAKPVRARYAPGIADRMMALAWWDWSHDRLRATLEDFRALSAEEFLERYE